MKQVGKNLLCAIVLAQLGSACGPPEPECGPGFAAAGTSCVDVNECADNNGGCNENRECLNDEGSFSCGECRAGFLKFGDTQCEDVDECADGTAHCRDEPPRDLFLQRLSHGFPRGRPRQLRRHRRVPHG